MDKERKTPTTALAKRQTSAVASYETIDGQMELFRKYKLSPTMVETHRFEKRGDYFALVKRSAPIKVFDDGAAMSAVSTVRQTYAEKVGLNTHRGKYNDENRLFEQDTASIEVGEVSPWSSI